MVSWWALKEFKKERILPASCHQIAATTYSEPWGNSRCEDGIVAPDSWDAYQRNDFSELRLLHLPRCREVLNFLTWDIWFPLTNSNLLMFPMKTTCPLSQNSYASKLPTCILAPQLPPQRTSFRVTWDAASWAWSPKNSLWVKHNPSFRLWTFF